MRPYGLADVAVLEANAVARGATIDNLMDHAGRAVAEEAAKHARAPPEGRIGIVCGGGNNGGDGFAAALSLRSKGYAVDLWLIVHRRDIRTRAARRRFEMIVDFPGINIGVPDVSKLKELDVVVDAMIGTGGRDELREPYLSAVKAIRESGVDVLSVDLPTGLGTSTALRPRWTVALEVPKEGMTHADVGEVVIRSIGFPRESLEETGPGEYLFFPRPGKSTSKGDSGRLVVVGGGPYTGAPALAALSALSAGVDMVFVVAPEPAATIIRGYSPDLIVRSVGRDGTFSAGDSDELWKTVESLHPDALLVGNGAGFDHGTVQAFSALLERSLPRIPVVLDADGTRLAAIRETRPLFGDVHEKLLLTPNRRELYRIVGYDVSVKRIERREQLSKLAHQLGATLLYKSDIDVITDGHDLRENTTHHPSLVVGGAGDVLSGLAASLMARRLTAFQAARLSSYWIGHASLGLFEKQSYGIRASDILSQLPLALKEGLSWVDGYLAGKPPHLPNLAPHAGSEAYPEDVGRSREEPGE